MRDYKCKLKFKHNDEIYTFMTEPNSFNNCQMWWFEPQKTMYAGTVKQAKTIEKNIRKNKELL